MPVKTYVTPYDDTIIAEAIKREIARGGQVYFLYNRVRSIEQMFTRLKRWRLRRASASRTVKCEKTRWKM